MTRPASRRPIPASAQTTISGGRQPAKLLAPGTGSRAPLELRSPEYNDVIGAPPPLAVRSGLVILAILLSCLATLAALLPYPAVVSAPVQLVSSAFPQEIDAGADGPLTMLKISDGQIVAHGQMLALIGGDGDSSVRLLVAAWLAAMPTAIMPESQLPALPNIDPQKLGSAGPEFVAASQALADFDAFKSNTAMQAELGAVQAQQAVYDQIQSLVARKQTSASAALKANQLLTQYRQKLVADGFAMPAYLAQFAAQTQTQTDLETDARLSSANNTLQQLSASSQIDNLLAARAEKQMAAATQLAASVSDLRKVMTVWSSTHLLVAPGEGRLRLFQFWSDNQQIHIGDNFATIDPPSVTVTAFSFVPSAGFGRVRVGQHVVIHLDAFPQAQFGLIEARVAAISQIAENGNYRLLFNLPRGLKTSHGNVINFTQHMTGMANVIVQPMSLLQHLLFGLNILFEPAQS